MKMIVIWNDGEKEKIEVTREYYENFNINKGFRGWVLTMVNGKGGWNLEYARKVWFEE